METSYTEHANILKALAEPTRLQIVDMLSCGELCACVIQEKFAISQPTLSHHMKVLTDHGIVIPRKEGKWTHYTLNGKRLDEIGRFIGYLSAEKEDCICKE